MSTFLLGLGVGLGVVAVWYFRSRAARDAEHERVSRGARNDAKRSAQSVEAAIRGRR